jgi:sugar lactone lactonase YvrE
VQVVADVGHEDYLWTAARPELVPGQFPDANPYGVLALPDSIWVVDAGANTIDRVKPNGKVRVVAFIPNPPASDAVPTCIDIGPDGALYVGELTGGGNAPGASTVWRYSPREHQLTQWATGLTAVTGCGFGPDGKFYATEFSTAGLDNAAPGTGAVVRVRPYSTSPETVVSGLDFPGGFAPGWDRSIYVSNWSISPASGAQQPSGEVLRIGIRSRHRHDHGDS